MDVLQLKQIALERRRDIVRMDYASSAGHVGGALSCIDIPVSNPIHQRGFAGDILRKPDRSRLLRETCR